jgi:hypothetical protein
MDNPRTFSRAPALARAAEAMLRAVGGDQVVLHCRVGPAAAEQARELGQSAPAVEDLTVSPVVGRPLPQTTSGLRVELLIARRSLARFLADRNQSAEDFFAAVLGLDFAGRTLHIERVTPEALGGDVFLYRVLACE